MATSRLRATAALVLPLVLALTSCSAGDGSSAPDGTPPAGDGGAACPEGFTPDAALGACVEIAPIGECPAGAMPEIGHAECQPVGWTSACPEGFERSPTGWGCVDRFQAPAQACAGATREDLKRGTCVAIGDCNAPFPPAAATLFVDDDGVEDATHFRTLAAATAQARAGDTIAVEAGTYPEVIELGKDKLNVVGRCAERVIFKGPVSNRAAVFVPDKQDVKLSGVTVTGFYAAIFVEGGSLTVEDVLIDDNDAVGVYVLGALGPATATLRRSKVSRTRQGVGEIGSGAVVKSGGVLTLEDSTFVDNDFRHASIVGEGSTLNVSGTVFARNPKRFEEAAAIDVEDGALARISRSAILDSSTQGVRVLGKGSRAELEESVVRRTRGTLAESGGVGIFAVNEGVVTLVSSAVTEHPVVGVYAGKGAGKVVVSKSVIVGVPPGKEVEFGRGASASESGRFEMTDTAVVGCPQSGVGLQLGASGVFERLYVKDARPTDEGTADSYGGFGLLVEDGSKATVTRSAFDGNSLAGMTSVRDADVTAEAVLIRNTKELPGRSPGSALQLAKGGSMRVTRSALVGNTVESVVVASGSTFSMSSSTVHGTRVDVNGAFGHGVVVFAGSRAELSDTAVYDSAAVGLISDGGEARVTGGTFGRNQVALHAQNGAAITQSEAAGELASGEVRISGTTRFVDNATRVGSGVLAIPQSPLE